MYNPYVFNPNILPTQQILQVNGKASVSTMQMSPNSSLLAMDTTAPIVWMCVSDGVGKVTATPYDIVQHEEEPPIDAKSIEQRLSAIETALANIEGKINAKSNDVTSKPKQNYADSRTTQSHRESGYDGSANAAV